MLLICREVYGNARRRLKFRRKKCERILKATANHRTLFVPNSESSVDCFDFWQAPKTLNLILRSMSKCDMYYLMSSPKRERERALSHADLDDCEREA